MAAELSHYSMMAFGQYLTEQTLKYEMELYSVCGNDKLELASVKRKYGQLEAYKTILKAFTDLYETDLSKFKKEYLNEGNEDSDEPEGTDLDSDT